METFKAVKNDAKNLGSSVKNRLAGVAKVAAVVGSIPATAVRAAKDHVNEQLSAKEPKTNAETAEVQVIIK